MSSSLSLSNALWFFSRAFFSSGEEAFDDHDPGLSFRLSGIAKSHQWYNSWWSTKIASYSIGIPRGIFLLLKVARTISPFFERDRAKKKNLKPWRHFCWVVELDYTINAWLKTIIIFSLANELKLDCIKIVQGKMSDKKWEKIRI